MTPRIAVLIPCYNEAEAIAARRARLRRRPARGDDLRLRQQLARRDARRAPRRPARSCVPRPSRAKATSCAGCSRTSRPRCTCSSTATAPTTLPSARRMVDMLLENSLDMVNGARVRDRRRRVPPRPPVRQPPAHGHCRRHLRRPPQGHAVRLPRDVAALHQVVSRARQRLRDRDRADRARARAAAADRRGPDAVPRPAAGSQSKLRTFRDGWRILRTIFFLVKEERPLQFFSTVALALLSSPRSCSAGRC